MNKFKNHFLTILFLAFIAFVISPKVLALIKGPAETPTIFASNYTIEQATLESQSSGKPILVLVTADWCAPCQALKRGALSDATVVDWVNDNMVPVYLEDSTNPEQIRMLPLEAFPTTFVLKDGQILGQFSGNTPPTKFLSRLKALSTSS